MAVVVLAEPDRVDLDFEVGQVGEVGQVVLLVGLVLFVVLGLVEGLAEPDRVALESEA